MARDSEEFGARGRGRGSRVELGSREFGNVKSKCCGDGRRC